MHRQKLAETEAARMPESFDIRSFFHEASSSITHVVADPASHRCAIIDPVLDFDPSSARTSTRFIDSVMAHVESSRLKVDWVLETHAHADHFSAAQHVRDATRARIAIGERIREVQRSFKRLFNLGDEFPTDGSQFDRLLADGDIIRIGDLRLQAMHTPGHTPACVSYVGGNCAFVGDTVFMPDYGSARADFPGGGARELYHSIRRILSLSGETVLYMCHDYRPGGRPAAWVTTVAEERRANIHLHDGIGEAEFVRMREARDKTLALPDLMLPALQVNIRAGNFPAAESNGISYLKLPINVLRS